MNTLNTQKFCDACGIRISPVSPVCPCCSAMQPVSEASRELSETLKSFQVISYLAPSVTYRVTAQGQFSMDVKTPDMMPRIVWDGEHGIMIIEVMTQFGPLTYTFIPMMGQMNYLGSAILYTFWNTETTLTIYMNPQ